MIHPVILSGGSGTRLWPMSRSLYPKQLLALFGDTSLLQQTVARVAAQPGFAPPVIVANEEHRFIIAEQLRALGVEPATGGGRAWGRRGCCSSRSGATPRRRRLSRPCGSPKPRPTR